MAASSTVEEHWVEKGLGGKHIEVRQVLLTLDGQGTVAAPIAASLFDMAYIIDCTPLVKSDNSVVVVAAPSYDHTQLLLKKNDDNVPAAYTGVFRCTIRGV